MMEDGTEDFCGAKGKQIIREGRIIYQASSEFEAGTISAALNRAFQQARGLPDPLSDAASDLISAWELACIAQMSPSAQMEVAQAIRRLRWALEGKD